ncbi:MAG: hypothetical protein WA151_17045, partial [Desulfatirhabdiaceae bacterium]
MMDHMEIDVELLPWEINFLKKLISKRFSLVKVKADENFNRRNIWNISRIEIFTQRRDWPKWS